MKGFTEALINDFGTNAPHVKVSVVMPGHIGTSIAINSNRIITGREERQMTPAELEVARKRWSSLGMLEDDASDEQVLAMMEQMGRNFRDNARTTAEMAASIILDGVREERWRILVGDDAHVLDEMVRSDPESAYSEEFIEKLRATEEWTVG